MSLSSYHQKYAQRSDEEIRKRAAVKERILSKVFATTGYATGAYPVRVAVLGSGDRRFVGYHQSMFEMFMRKAVDMVTFDITVEHLAGANGVVQHDVTLPIPKQPYDVAYSDLLLRFIETDKQWDALKNSYDLLRAPGVAVHVLNKEELASETAQMPDGFFAVPLERWKERMDENGIRYQELDVVIEGIEPEPIEQHVLMLLK